MVQKTTKHPKQGGQTHMKRFDDGSALTFGIRGTYTRLSPSLEVGETLYHREIIGQNAQGQPLGRISTADVVGFEDTNVVLETGVRQRYDKDSITQFVNDPSVMTWTRDRPAELATGESTTRVVDPLWATAVPEPRTPAELTWTRLSGDGARTEANEFLNGDFDGAVNHTLGGVRSHLALFKGTYAGHTLSVLVLGPPYNPQQNGRGIVTLRRLANRPEAPPNTSSWMIARAREWASSRGYNRLETFAGVGDNDGTCYEAAGMEFVGAKTVSPDDEGWENRPGRSRTRASEWERRKYVASL